MMSQPRPASVAMLSAKKRTAMAVPDATFREVKRDGSAAGSHTCRTSACEGGLLAHMKHGPTMFSKFEVMLRLSSYFRDL